MKPGKGCTDKVVQNENMYLQQPEIKKLLNFSNYGTMLCSSLIYKNVSRKGGIRDRTESRSKRNRMHL